MSPARASGNWSSAASSARFKGIDEAFEDGATVPSYPGVSLVGRKMVADDKRPEKSAAVAGRLIAAGIGAKAPRRTEEQKQYDRAVKTQERKKKERGVEEERRRVEEAERAKRSVWED